MAFFNSVKLETANNEPIDPATEEGLTLLRRIFYLLKPLGQITGGGSNRLSVDVNTLGTVTTVTTVTTTTTVGTVTNLANVGGVAGFEHMKALSRAAYNTGVRSNIT
jgi:hypothetical protein